MLIQGFQGTFYLQNVHFVIHSPSCCSTVYDFLCETQKDTFCRMFELQSSETVWWPGAVKHQKWQKASLKDIQYYTIFNMYNTAQYWSHMIAFGRKDSNWIVYLLKFVPWKYIVFIKLAFYLDAFRFLFDFSFSTCLCFCHFYLLLIDKSI